MTFRRLSCQKQCAHTVLALSSGWTKTSPCHLHDQNLCLAAFYGTVVEFSQSHANIQIYTRKTQRWCRSLLFSRRAGSRPLHLCHAREFAGERPQVPSWLREEVQNHVRSTATTRHKTIGNVWCSRRRCFSGEPHRHHRCTILKCHRSKPSNTPCTALKPPCSASRNRLTSQNTTELSWATIAYTADVRRSVFTVVTTFGGRWHANDLLFRKSQKLPTTHSARTWNADPRD